MMRVLTAIGPIPSDLPCRQQGRRVYPFTAELKAKVASPGRVKRIYITSPSFRLAGLAALDNSGGHAARAHR